MQLAVLAAADLGLKRCRKEERMLGQLQRLGASIRRVRGGKDADVLQLRGEALVQAIAAIVEALERRLPADRRQPSSGHRRYRPPLAVQRALQSDDDVLIRLRIRF